ncbi:uncharacterized protein BYT42DRAFT_573331 [Radiomyces spectabilis]|uniref:uncharacterized protein n=1 Tax=Radiomyces spectabilis TaxID=64574 RepID=UPI00222079E1|nr:uncharacterized protein BYT42DRAFT_573331 [Radiomyces spectabilis]KAI8376082.1 hypothetical protein BYT42DRAFT_573331 [Radiomyces spectabilis]
MSCKRIKTHLLDIHFFSVYSSFISTLTIMAERVLELVATRHITIFSKADSPETIPAVSLLEETFGFSPFILYLDQDPEGTEIEHYLMHSTRQQSLPNIFIKKHHIGDFNSLMMLHQTGQLKSAMA